MRCVFDIVFDIVFDMVFDVLHGDLGAGRHDQVNPRIFEHIFE